jgi:hypothetical protein
VSRAVQFVAQPSAKGAPVNWNATRRTGRPGRTFVPLRSPLRPGEAPR